MLAVFCGCVSSVGDDNTAPLAQSPSESRIPLVVGASADSMVALVNGKQYAKAIRLFEKTQALATEPPSAEDLIAYLDALVYSGETRKLFDILMVDRGPSPYDRDIAAWSLIQIGDRHMKKGDSEAALLEGYLRACLLFSKGTCMRRRALVKTIQALHSRNDDRVERFRTVLRDEFPETQTPQQSAR